MTATGFRYYGYASIGRGRQNRLVCPEPVFEDPRGGQLKRGDQVKIARDASCEDIIVIGDIPLDSTRYKAAPSENKFSRVIGEADRRLGIPDGLLAESEGAVPKPPTENGSETVGNTTSRPMEDGAELLLPGERIHFISRLTQDAEQGYIPAIDSHVYLLTDDQLNRIISQGWVPEEYIDVDRMNSDEFYRDVSPLSSGGGTVRTSESGLRRQIGRVLALGSAQDGGIPHLDCVCPVCKAAREDEDATRKINAIQVNSLGSPDERILFEATPDIRYQIEEIPHHIFLSHDFSGHISGLTSLSFESINADRVPVYCTSELADILAAGPFERLSRNKNIELNSVHDGMQINIGSIVIEINILSYQWGDTDALAYLIEGPKKKLAYLPIVAEWTDNVLEMVETADWAIVDGLLWDEDEVTRSNVPDVCIQDSIEIFDTRDISTEIYFTRLNHTNEVLEYGGEYEELDRRGYQLLDHQTQFTI